MRSNVIMRVKHLNLNFAMNMNDLEFLQTQAMLVRGLDHGFATFKFRICRIYTTDTKTNSHMWCTFCVMNKNDPQAANIKMCNQHWTTFNKSIIVWLTQATTKCTSIKYKPNVDIEKLQVLIETTISVIYARIMWCDVLLNMWTCCHTIDIHVYMKTYTHDCTYM